MSDLIERLRNIGGNGGMFKPKPLALEAADEIERLRAQVESQGDWIRIANRVMNNNRKNDD